MARQNAEEKPPLPKGGCLRSRRGDSLQIESGKLKVENAGTDIIRPFKKRWFAEEHLIRHRPAFSTFSFQLYTKKESPRLLRRHPPLTREAYPPGYLFRLRRKRRIHLLLSRRRQTPLSAAQTSPLTGESPQGEGKEEGDFNENRGNHCGIRSFS